MGLGNNRGKFTYVNIRKGSLFTKKDEQELLYENLEGTITDITIVDDEYKGKQFKKLQLLIVDGPDKFLLQMRLDSGYGIAFCMICPHIDFNKPVNLSPIYSEKDGKGKAGMFVNQNGVALKWAWTKDIRENDRFGKLPQLEKGSHPKLGEYWDNSAQQEFFIDMLLSKIKPTLKHEVLAGPGLQAETTSNAIPDVEGVSAPVDDLPF